MAKIKNDTCKVRIGSVVITKKYSELCSECLGASSATGISISEMKDRLRIMDLVEKSNGEINIEGRDLLTLKKSVLEMRWAFISPEIIKFNDVIESAK